MITVSMEDMVEDDVVGEESRYADSSVAMPHQRLA